MYYPRELRDCWQSASDQFPVLLLTGARQVGKTTFLRHLQKDQRKYVTLDDPASRALAIEDPALFLQRYEPPVLIDEIQYAPQLLPFIKISVDRGAVSGSFWLTGSQQFQMMKGISETLAGRVKHGQELVVHSSGKFSGLFAAALPQQSDQTSG